MTYEPEQPGLFHQHPPRRSKAFATVLTVILVLTLVAFAYMALVSPGFLIRDEGDVVNESDRVKRVASDAVRAINTRDDDLGERVTCPGNSLPDFGSLPPDLRAEVAGEPTVEGATARITVTFTQGQQSRTEEFRFNKIDDRWCVGR